MTADRRPDFLYIGTSKAGSTWLFNMLAIHDEVFLASSKGLYYFDGHFDKGEAWYLGHFAGAGDTLVSGEISHSYLSSPEAPARIAAVNPAMLLVACLREPVDRAFSDYLDLVKNRQFNGSFEAAMERYPRLLDRGRYATHLHHFLDTFPRDQLHVGLFDDLKSDPQAYADSVVDFLGVGRLTLPPTALASRMPAARPRSERAAAAAKVGSRFMKRSGLQRVRSRVKRSALVRNALYRPYVGDRPQLDPVLNAELRASFASEVEELDTLLDVSVSQRWGYAEPATPIS